MATSGLFTAQTPTAQGIPRADSAGHIDPAWLVRGDLTAPVSILSVSGGSNSVFGTGVTLSLATQSANLVWAGPTTGAAAAPTFRTLVTADIPDLSGTYLVRANNLSDLTSAATARTNLGGTTAGQSFLTLTNPSAITFPRINADNTVSALDAATFRTAIGAGTGSGTVTTISVVSANGLSGTVANPTTTPAITLTTSITGLLKGNGTAISAATSGTDYSSGTSALATGILKSTTATGSLTIAVAGDFPTLNQNTTGSAATLTTPRAINGVNFDGSAAITVAAAAGTLTGATLAAGVTASSLTSLGTIAIGVWHGTAIATTYGGVATGGTTNQVLAKNSNSDYDLKWVTVAGGSSANPSATIGLTAVNGSAGTFMTSDSAPALDQAISPTMTGLWIFGNTTQATSATTGSVVVSGGLSTAKDAWIGGTKLYVGNAPGNANSSAEIRVYGWNTANMNWQISTAVQSPSGLCITPSTAAGGTTFSHPEAQFIPTGLILGDAVDKGSNHDVQLQLLGWSSSFTNWQISTAVQSATGLCFTPSTAAGGTTFSSPVLNLFSSGIVQMTGYGSGAATFDASGNLSSVSDETMKTNMVPSAYGLKELRGFKPIIFNYHAKSGLDTKHRYGGWGAQSVLPWIPEAVGTNRDGTRSLNPWPIVGAMQNAIINLDDRVAKLELAPASGKI